MAKRLEYHVVDVFTDRTFAGNPLAVVLDADGVADAALQAIAAEFNLSETAFPVTPDVGDSADYRLRIFTPESELPFAGHPSVGTAWLLTDLGRVRSGRLHQRCGAGLLPLDVRADGFVELTAGTPSASGPVDPAPLLAAVGLTTEDADGPPPRRCSTGLMTGFLSVTEDAVVRASPDLAALRRLDVETLSVFAWHGDERRAHARVFAASLGVPEDPATGSAAAAFGAWLAASGLVIPEGETAYVVTQGVEMGRPSRLECAVVTRDGVAVECRVGGRVVPVATGTIAVPN